MKDVEDVVERVGVSMFFVFIRGLILVAWDNGEIRGFIEKEVRGAGL